MYPLRRVQDTGEIYLTVARSRNNWKYAPIEDADDARRLAMMKMSTRHRSRTGARSHGNAKPASDVTASTAHSPLRLCNLSVCTTANHNGARAVGIIMTASCGNLVASTSAR